MEAGLFSRLLHDFEEAVLSLDQVKAREIVFHSGKDLTPIQRVDEWMVPVLEKIGLDWEKGDVSLAQVYMSGRICEDLVDELLPQGLADKRGRPKTAIAVLEDYHLLGKRVVYAVLRSAGFDILDYGHGLKADDIVERVTKEKTRILLISTLMLPSALKVKQVREKLDEAGLQVSIVVGGAPFLFDDRLWKDVGADAMGRSASDAIDILRRLMEVVS